MNCATCGAPVDRAHVLTRTQVRFLEKVHELKEVHGRFPFIQELRRALNYRSIENARYHVRKLERQGWLTVSRRKGGVLVIESARRVA